MPRAWKKAFFVTLYGLLLFAVLEIGARAALSWSPIFRRVARHSNAAWRLEWVARRASPASGPYAFDVFDRIRGWAPKPLLHEVTAFHGKRLSTNSEGLRGTSEVRYEKTPGRRRILALGDSFTFGEEVSDSETYCHLLGELLPDTEVLNFGVHGYGLDQILIYLREEGVKYRPDLVLLGFVYEDIYRDLLSFRDYAKPQFRLDNQGTLTLSHVPVPSPDQVLAQTLWRPRILDLLEMLEQARRWWSGANQKDAEAVSRAILREMAQTARRSGARPVFFYFPVEKELLDRRPGQTLGESFLFEVCHELALDCFSLRPDLAARADPGERAVTQGHWPASVHKQAALLLRDRLGAAHLLEGKP